MDHNILGKQGEHLAIEFLKSKGHHILDTNWRFHHLEIDIISVDGCDIVFTEVKTRGSRKYELPYQAVTGNKIRNIVMAADSYIKQKCIDLEVRFDIISIVISNNSHELDHIADAFYPPLLR